MNDLNRQVDVLCKYISDFANYEGFEPYDDIAFMPTNLRTLIESVSVSYMSLDGHWKGITLKADDYKKNELYFEKGSAFIKKILSEEAYKDFIRLCKAEPFPEDEDLKWKYLN